MSAFREKEIEYLNGQRLGRLATVDAEGNPHFVPFAYRYNEKLDAVDIGGHNFAGSKKFRGAGKTGRAAFVVDDVLASWRGRGVEVRGRAEVRSDGGKKIVSWGVDSDAFSPNSRSVG